MILPRNEGRPTYGARSDLGLVLDGAVGMRGPEDRHVLAGLRMDERLGRRESGTKLIADFDAGCARGLSKSIVVRAARPTVDRVRV